MPANFATNRVMCFQRFRAAVGEGERLLARACGAGLWRGPAAESRMKNLVRAVYKNIQQQCSERCRRAPSALHVEKNWDEAGWRAYDAKMRCTVQGTVRKTIGLSTGRNATEYARSRKKKQR